MNKYVYHGSTTGGLKVLKPNISSHLKEYVYATEKRAVALIFASRSNRNLDRVIRIEESPEKCILVERWNGAFERNFNRSGYIYTLNGENFKHSDEVWYAEVVSTFEEKVLKEEYIPNLYEELRKCSEKGEIVLYTYPDRPDDIPLDNSDILDEYEKVEKKGMPGLLRSVLNVYPEFEKEVYRRLNKEIPKYVYIVSDKDELNSKESIIYNGRGEINVNGYAAFEEEIFALSSAEPFIREDGWISYDIENDKFIFRKGKLDTSKKLYIYTLSRNGFKRANMYEFYSDKKPEIVSMEVIDFSKYIA